MFSKECQSDIVSLQLPLTKHKLLVKSQVSTSGTFKSKLDTVKSLK